MTRMAHFDLAGSNLALFFLIGAHHYFGAHSFWRTLIFWRMPGYSLDDESVVWTGPLKRVWTKEPQSIYFWQLDSEASPSRDANGA